MTGDLDAPQTLARLAGLATRVIHLAPPEGESSNEWWRDRRTVSLLRALRRRVAPLSLVYGSTSGVYGDCGGEHIDETRALRPRTPRAQRRADAEYAVRHYGRATGVRASILRIPGIYAPDREGGTPRERLLKSTPVLRREDDVYTNHIHADDLARAVLAALWRGKPQRAYNVNDDTELKMGDYFDLAADLYKLPRPPRVPRSTAQDELLADAAQFHERVPAHGQPPAEERAAAGVAVSDGERRSCSLSMRALPFQSASQRYTALRLRTL